MARLGRPPEPVRRVQFSWRISEDASRRIRVAAARRGLTPGRIVEELAEQLPKDADFELPSDDVTTDAPHEETHNAPPPQ